MGGGGFSSGPMKACLAMETVAWYSCSMHRCIVYVESASIFITMRFLLFSGNTLFLPVKWLILVHLLQNSP